MSGVSVSADILDAALRATNAEASDISMACVHIACRTIIAERERCAKIAETVVNDEDEGVDAFTAGQIIAAAIRKPEGS